jgi:hypothetical protein
MLITEINFHAANTAFCNMLSGRHGPMSQPIHLAMVLLT